MNKEVAISCISTFQKLAEFYGDYTIHDWPKDKKLALVNSVIKYRRINYRQYLQEKQQIEGVYQ